MACIDTYEIPCIKSGDYFGGLTLTLEEEYSGSYIPIDITSYDIEITLRKRGDSSTQLALAVGSGITITDPTNGICVIDEIVSVSLPKGEYSGYLQYTNTQDERTTYALFTWQIL